MPNKKWIALILGVILLLIALASVDQEKKWDGVDTAVVGKFGTELGRAPWKPFINLQGDALLFAFTISGSIGGFAAGYYWRELFGNDGNVRTRSDGDAYGKEASQDV